MLAVLEAHLLLAHMQLQQAALVVQPDKQILVGQRVE
jgi:hypothetical protein